MAKHLTVEQRKMARRYKAAGFTLRETAAQLGCAFSTAREVWYFESQRTPKSEEWTPGPGRLMLGDREEISLGLHSGESFAAIARRLGRSTSTVSREVAANGGRAGYRAWRAHRRAGRESKRPKARKLAENNELLTRVVQWLELWWSPEQIARRLRIEFPADPMMRVSHETIYQSLFVQGRGELRRELARCLRSGRAKRQPQHREKPKRIKDMVMISARPAAVEDRAVPGHREGDLIIGKDGGSAVGTLVERSTRYLLLLHLPEDRSAAAVDTSMRRAIATLPGELFRTITWDQGKELALHASFTVATGIQVYFCDPHSPWQRGSNENTNGLLRQYLPKSTDLSVHGPRDLAAIARSLNNRPRKTLGFMKPSEKLAELLAHTA